jgi:hypothetical protein
MECLLAADLVEEGDAMNGIEQAHTLGKSHVPWTAYEADMRVWKRPPQPSECGFSDEEITDVVCLQHDDAVQLMTRSWPAVPIYPLARGRM